MSFTLVFAPITSPRSIILWEKVSIFNYVRAIAMIIGCAFLPGACIFNIFFHDNNLHERFKVEPFIIKITLYPLLSFSFLGISVLILDQIGLTNINLFTLILFLIIVYLFLADIIIQKKRTEKLNIEIVKISISKYTFFILSIAIGMILITIGIHISIYYLISGDSWVALTFANYICKPNVSPIERGRELLSYPIFWSYIIYGFSNLSGLPFLNTSTLLITFNYLYILTVYLLMKALLLGYKEKYAVGSTFLTSFFSALFYITTSSNMGSNPAILHIGLFYFIYKSYALVLFIISVAIFIIISKTSEEEVGIYKNSYIKIKDGKYLILSSYLIVISYMVYTIPFLIGLLLIFLYCLVSDKKQQDFRLFSYVILFISLIFISLDLLMFFYLSLTAYNMVQWFFNIGFIIYIATMFPIFILIYISLVAFYIVIRVIPVIYDKHLKERKRFLLKYSGDPKKIFKVCLIIFTIFLIIEIISIILEEFFLKFYLDDRLIFFYILDEVYINIGLIGIIATYVSYFCFENNKKLFFILISWILVLFALASVLLILNMFKYRTFFIKDISSLELLVMHYWFSRIWSFSIFPICIIFSIGSIKFIKFLKNHPKFKNIFENAKKKRTYKNILFSLFIFLTCSNLIITGLLTGNGHNRVKDEDVELIGWLSNNLQDDSGILIERGYEIRLMVFSMTTADYYFIHDYFDSDDTNAEMVNEIDDLKEDEIQYILLTKDFLFDDNNVSIFIKLYLIPNFYNESEYESDNYRVYYAPYFD